MKKKLQGIGFYWWVVIMATIVMMAVVILYPDGANTNAVPEPIVQQSFDDVPPDHWAYEEIELIFSHGITVGCSYDPPLYCPDRPATRAEMAVFAARILEIIEQNK